MWKFAIVILVLGLGKPSSGEEIDWHKYYKMPPLHHYDDYDSCLLGNEGYGVFCVTHAIIKPDNSSSLWRYIEEFSSDRKRHFAHDLLMPGVCIESCEERLKGLTQKQLDDLYVEEFPYRVRYTYDITAFRNVSEYRKNYNRLINQCNNLWLRQNYNLSAYSTIQYCTDTNDAATYEYNYLHYLFFALLFVIIAVVSSATYIDKKQNTNGTLAFYKVEVKDASKAKGALLCFSLARNWYRLVAPPKNELGRDFRFILAMRYLTTFLVILGHVVNSYAVEPHQNPEFIEATYHNISTLFYQSGLTVVQTFFVIGGVLLYISMNELMKKNKMGLKHIVIAIIYRWLRLTPAYAFLILYHASWFYPSGSGSFWGISGGMEETFCRRYWWSHLLYINNIVNPGQQCMVQTWYLAVDTQLFLCALVLFYIMSYFPKHKTRLLLIAMLGSFVIQFVLNYINEFDGIFILLPEAKRFLVDNVYDELEKNYIATYTNAGNYLAGIGIGMVYHYVRKNKSDWGRHAWFRLAWLLVPVIGTGVLQIFSWVFINHTFAKPSVWIALVSVVSRNFWGILALTFFSGFFFKFRSPIKNFFNWPVFTPLARLTYCIYLSHMTVGRTLIGQFNGAIYVNTGLMLTQTVSIFVLSNVFALFLCLCLEFPMTALTKQLLQREKEVNTEEVQAINMEVNGNNKALKL